MSKRTAAQPQQLSNMTVPARMAQSDARLTMSFGQGVRAGLSNLYRFIRLILGEQITDSAIARKWNMDGKNFSEFKHNKYPAPRVDRLVTLGKILDVDDHLVYEVAKGTPAERVFNLIKKLRLKKVRRMSGRWK